MFFSEFNALYRWHSMIPEELNLETGEVPIGDTLWDPSIIAKRGLAGMFNDISSQRSGMIGAQNTWQWLVKHAEEPVIRMCRDCEIASYNDYREMSLNIPASPRLAIVCGS